MSSHETYPASGETGAERRPEPYGATYVELIPDPAWTDATFVLSGEASVPWGVGLVGIPREDGAYHEQDYRAEPDGTLQIELQQWNRFERIGIGVANLTDLAAGAGLIYGSPFSYEVEVSTARAVDPAQTTVQADPASLPADGQSRARILVTPRDSAGVLFGPDREVVIAADRGSMIGLPTEVEGGVTFQWYRAAEEPGTATVSVTVDGVAIDNPAIIELTAAGDADSDADSDVDTDADADADGGGGSGCAVGSGTTLLGVLLLLPLVRRRRG